MSEAWQNDDYYEVLGDPNGGPVTLYDVPTTEQYAGRPVRAHTKLTAQLRRNVLRKVEENLPIELYQTNVWVDSTRDGDRYRWYAFLPGGFGPDWAMTFTALADPNAAMTAFLMLEAEHARQIENNGSKLPGHHSLACWFCQMHDSLWRIHGPWTETEVWRYRNLRRNDTRISGGER